MNEIWIKFKEDLKVALDNFLEGIRKVAKSTFKIFKNGCLEFIKSIFEWIYELSKGACLVLYSLLQVIWASLISALKASAGILYKKVISFVKKW